MNNADEPIRLYSARTCPFAHRARLILFTKGIAFDLIEIDLDNPPPDFRALSPYGKVPLLQHGEEHIWESAVINEYLEECFPEPALFPNTPAERAKARIWIDYANNYFVPLFYKLLLKQTREEQASVAGRLAASLLFLEQQALARTDSFWMGRQTTLVDFSFYPFFERFPVLEHFRGFTIPAKCKRLQQWLEAMQDLPAVKEYQNPLALYLERYQHYADATVNNDTSREMLEK